MRKAREKLGLRQIDIAVQLGKTQPTINEWENDKSHPRTVELRGVAKVYRLRIDQLVPGEAA